MAYVIIPKSERGGLHGALEPDGPGATQRGGDLGVFIDPSGPGGGDFSFYRRYELRCFDLYGGVRRGSGGQRPFHAAALLRLRTPPAMHIPFGYWPELHTT